MKVGDIISSALDITLYADHIGTTNALQMIGTLYAGDICMIVKFGQDDNDVATSLYNDVVYDADEIYVVSAHGIGWITVPNDVRFKLM